MFNLKAEGEIDLEKLDHVIHGVVPAGFNIHNKPVQDEMFGFNYERLRCWKNLKNHDRLKRSMGTLGGGNHYIEVDVDENGEYWLSIHCGSRNLGLQVANYYQEKAIKAQQERMDFIKQIGNIMVANAERSERQAIIQANRSAMRAFELDKDLCYLEGRDMEDYLYDMDLCQSWSLNNHLEIYDLISTGMRWSGSSGKYYCGKFDDYKMITSIHNYVDIENKIIRKGAIAAYKGQECIIPLNMRDGVLIVEALGNEDWNCSLPHGAGRVMSRAEARKTVDLEEYKDTMKDIYSTCVCEKTLDEAPEVYKDHNAIIEAIKDNAVIKQHLRPVYNFKAKD
jgi:RNA-splicing ligase RtcB